MPLISKSLFLLLSSPWKPPFYSLILLIWLLSIPHISRFMQYLFSMTGLCCHMLLSHIAEFPSFLRLNSIVCKYHIFFVVMLSHIAEFPSFLRLNSIVCKYHIFFILSFVNGYFSCFYILAIVNSAAHPEVLIAFWDSDFSSCG